MTDTPDQWGEERRKTVVWHDPMRTVAAGVSLSGLDFLRSIRDGATPPPPMAALFGMQVREVDVGRVVFECDPDESTYNPVGTVHGGLVCTLADSVAGCAVHSTLEAGFVFTSIDITVNYLRPVTSQSGTLRAVGIVTKPGRRVAFASVEIFDGSQKLVATATSSCLVMERPSP
ncbi:MAG TPA: PaaI family thioesterase [Acidimicrobiales bacterium]|jgi:uncharacterized protein (TIGR00369 family)|nr:PaaI family thioesterase [Acidimicrobiales bacterium]